MGPTGSQGSGPLLLFAHFHLPVLLHLCLLPSVPQGWGYPSPSSPTPSFHFTIRRKLQCSQCLKSQTATAHQSTWVFLPSFLPLYVPTSADAGIIFAHRASSQCQGPPYFLRRGFSLRLELTTLARLASHRVPSILQSLHITGYGWHTSCSTLNSPAQCLQWLFPKKSSCLGYLLSFGLPFTFLTWLFWFFPLSSPVSSQGSESCPLWAFPCVCCI